ncbi:hypothetical protein HK104_002731 [Borealophlyctis nickersoniae]|nr:hypothetical protein HK104_002731 [Borealophlyctis nickersoniae]
MCHRSHEKKKTTTPARSLSNGHVNEKPPNVRQCVERSAKAVASFYVDQWKKGHKEAIEMNAGDAMAAKKLADAQKKEARDTKKAVDGDRDGRETPGKKQRKKYLKFAGMEHWGSKRDAEKATPVENIDTNIRSISFRFFPSPELATGLLNWVEVADDMDAHVKEVAETYAQRGQKLTLNDMRDRHITLTQLQYNKLMEEGRLGTLKDLDRRRPYMSLPAVIQDRIVRRAMAGLKSCQTNLERGHIDGYETGRKDPERRWKTLYLAAQSMSVGRLTGEVRIHPRSADGDRGVYIRDSLVRFLTPATTKHATPPPTKHWGRHLICGSPEGRDFEIRYDTRTQKWFLILHYDAMVRGAPFRPEVLDAIMKNPDPAAKRARTWIMRSETLFGGSNCNLCSIDPGVRTPWTCFDVQRRSCYDVFPDLAPKSAEVHREISLLQSRRDGVGVAGGRVRSLNRKRERKKAAGKSKKRKQVWRPNIDLRIRGLYDKLGARVRQAHGAFGNHLGRNYDTMVLPEFLTANMLRKRRKLLKLPPLRNRNDTNSIPKEGKFTLPKATRKALRSISHYRFRQRLVAKAAADPNGIKDVIITTEEYTTKQCPFCGFVNHDIGGSKVFVCGNDGCRFVGRRDNVGAFNVGLRSVVKGEVNAEESSREMVIGVEGARVENAVYGAGAAEIADGEDQLKDKEDALRSDQEKGKGDGEIVIEDEELALDAQEGPMSSASKGGERRPLKRSRKPKSGSESDAQSDSDSHRGVGKKKKAKSHASSSSSKKQLKEREPAKKKATKVRDRNVSDHNYEARRKEKGTREHGGMFRDKQRSRFPMGDGSNSMTM